MVKMYGKKIVVLDFIYKEDGENLKDIINKSFKEELYNKKLLFGDMTYEKSKD